MTETTEQPPTGEPESTTAPLFVRQREGRMIGGVCAGIAARWNIDVTLVRIVTVAIAVTSGVGIVAYLAAWLLTPSTERAARWSPETFRRRPRRFPMMLLILILGLLLATSIGHAFWWWGPPAGLLVVVILGALVVGTRRGRWLLVSVSALLAIALGTTAAFGAHFGTRTFHVATVDDLHGEYDYGVGTVHLDLSALTVTGRHQTEVHVGRGDVTVSLPSNVAVVVHGQAGIGSVTINGHEVSGIDAEQTQAIGPGGDSAADRLDLDIVVGAGTVDVRTG